jgi:hypothetical protein
MSATMNGDWDRWSDAWLAEHVTDTELARLIERTARTRRAIVGMRALSLAIAVVALAAVGAALYHAASALEVVLGVAVAVGICVAWIIDSLNQRSAHEHADEPPAQYQMLRRALSVRRIRFARLLWTLAALDLVFLFPWWAGGMRYHGFGFRLVHLTSLWGPLALIVGAVIAAARIRARGVDELTSIDHRSEIEATSEGPGEDSAARGC